MTCKICKDVGWTLKIDKERTTERHVFLLRVFCAECKNGKVLKERENILTPILTKKETNMENPTIYLAIDTYACEVNEFETLKELEEFLIDQESDIDPYDVYEAKKLNYKIAKTVKFL